MSDNKEPREFWIVKHFAKPGVIVLIVHETKPEWKSLQLGDERIHVIEYSAYEASMEAHRVSMSEVLELLPQLKTERAKNAKLVEALERVKQYASEGVTNNRIFDVAHNALASAPSIEQVKENPAPTPLPTPGYSFKYGNLKSEEQE